MKFTRILVDKRGPMARVTLNRPKTRNAMDELALEEITRAFKELGRDSGVRVVVLGGKGPDFCAGADIGWMRRGADNSRARSRRDAQRLIGMCCAVDEAPFAVIGRVQGNCFGGGLGLAAACDIVVAEDSARFRFSEARLGIIPAVVSTFALIKIGPSQARRLYMTAEVFSASVAKELGLVHVVAPAARLDLEVDRNTAMILGNGPIAVRQAKAFIRKYLELTRADRIVYSRELLARIRSTPEAREGLSAFLDKREPKWALSSE